MHFYDIYILPFAQEKVFFVEFSFSFFRLQLKKKLKKEERRTLI